MYELFWKSFITRSIKPFHLGYDSRHTAPFLSEHVLYNLPFLLSLSSLWHGMCGTRKWGISKRVPAQLIFTISLSGWLVFVINNSFLSIFTAKWWSKGSDIASDLSDRHVGQQAWILWNNVKYSMQIRRTGVSVVSRQWQRRLLGLG